MYMAKTHRQVSTRNFLSAMEGIGSDSNKSEVVRSALQNLREAGEQHDRHLRGGFSTPPPAARPSSPCPGPPGLRPATPLVWAQWHRLNLDHETIEAMPEKRRTLFRGVWELGGNREYSLENRSL